MPAYNYTCLLIGYVDRLRSTQRPLKELGYPVPELKTAGMSG